MAGFHMVLATLQWLRDHEAQVRGGDDLWRTMMATDDEIEAALQAASAHVIDLAENPNGEIRGILEADVHQMVLDVRSTWRAVDL